MVSTITAVDALGVTKINGRIEGPNHSKLLQWGLEVDASITAALDSDKGFVVVGTFDELTKIPETDEISDFPINTGGMVLNDGNSSGRYRWDGVKWTDHRPFDVSLARLSQANVDVNDIVAVPESGVGTLVADVFYISFQASNTGPMTLDIGDGAGSVPLRSFTGIDAPAKLVVPGRPYFIQNGTDERLLVGGFTDDANLVQSLILETLEIQEEVEGRATEINQTAQQIEQTAQEVEVVAEIFTEHAQDQKNPHKVTKAQVNLGNVDNTSDLNKPISTKTQAALDAKLDADAVEGAVQESLAALQVETISPEFYGFKVEDGTLKLQLGGDASVSDFDQAIFAPSGIEFQINDDGHLVAIL